MKKTIKRASKGIIAMSSIILCFFCTEKLNKVNATGEGLTNPRIEYLTRDIVQFGEYWQEDTNGDGKCDENDNKQPIEWQVLYEDLDSNALLLSDKIIDYDSFGSMMSTWYSCGLREYLNNEFLNCAFSVTEQNHIIESRINGDFGSGYKISEDKLFLLSTDEAWDPDYKLADMQGATEARIGRMTGYAYQKCQKKLKDGNAHNWFLRTNGRDAKGENDHYINIVNEYGEKSMIVTYSAGGVRPALRINLKSSGIEIKEKRNISVNRTTWDAIKFGNYSGFGIVWRVLSVEGDKVFVVADRCIEKKPFHVGSKVMNWAGGSWKDSEIRKWLNGKEEGDFYNIAFNTAEKNAIKSMTITNPGNQLYGISSGDSTEDSIFLLSIDDVANEKYGFSKSYNCMDDGRSAYDNNGKSVSWWLRTTGTTESNAVFVWESGRIDFAGEKTINEDVGIRPAMYIDMSSPVWEKVKSIASNDIISNLEPESTITPSPTPIETIIPTQSPTPIPVQNSTTTSAKKAFKIYLHEHWGSTITVKKALTYGMEDYLDCIDRDYGRSKMTRFEKKFAKKTDTTLKKIKLKMDVFQYYKFKDLDMDGTPECFLTDSGLGKMVSSLLILDCKKGKISPLMFFAGIKNGIRKKENGSLVIWYGGSDFSQLLEYRIKKHTIQPNSFWELISGKYKKSGKPTITYGKRTKFNKRKKTLKSYNNMIRQLSNINFSDVYVLMRE